MNDKNTTIQMQIFDLVFGLDQNVKMKTGLLDGLEQQILYLFG